MSEQSGGGSAPGCRHRRGNGIPAALATAESFVPKFTHDGAEVLLWLAQGKTNPEIASILGISESTVKKHMMEIMGTLGVETRTAASSQALEILSSVPRQTHGQQRKNFLKCARGWICFFPVP